MPSMQKLLEETSFSYIRFFVWLNIQKIQAQKNALPNREERFELYTLVFIYSSTFEKSMAAIRL